MRLFAPFSVCLQISNAAAGTGSADYDFIDFWDLIKRLEEIKSQSETVFEIPRPSMDASKRDFAPNLKSMV